MRIESFWAKGYRSLRDVRIEGLGAFNVFYGPNGSGKSNILAAIEAWLRLIPIALKRVVSLDTHPRLPLQRRIEVSRGIFALQTANAPLAEQDFALHSPGRLMTLGGALSSISADVKSVEIEVHLDATSQQEPTLHANVIGDEQVAEAQRETLASLSIDWPGKFSLVPADRMPRTDAPAERPPAGAEPLSWYFRRGRLKDALFAAQNTTASDTLRALERFRQIMAGPPLHRPAFRTVEDPSTGVRDLREWLPPPLDANDVSLDLAGLGIAQIYWIIGQAMLSGARLVGIEEPEAHLHAPTTGLHLRQLLARLVDEKHIDQLFIATHSNLFDLDPERYWDVSLVNGETKVEPKPLHEIDARHLYEPGPALHALEELLSIAAPDKVMFRHPDGSPITATAMVKMLREADPTALDYLRNLQAAAVDVVGLRNRRAQRP
jgi:hypothetical protein